MKKKKIVILILQMILILISVFAFNRYTREQIKPVEAYIYSGDINDLSKILTEDDIKSVTIPKSAITTNFALNKEDILNKCVDSKVKKGQYIYINQLVKPEEVDIFNFLDLSKYRKISLPISFVDSFSGNIKKGDKVDLVYTGEGTKSSEDSYSGEEDFMYSKVFMQDVLVYSVNTDEGYKYMDYSECLSDDIEANEKQEIKIITLAVTLEQAEEIEARTNTGKVRFLGRFADSKSYNTLGYVLGDYQQIFSGRGFAETDRAIIEEDDFDIIELEKTEK